ncbi:nucleotidyltransferase family protein [Sneathiella marina]|uniref:Nucleotidyltransferase family protein n=1 Tax=Sneathiella marina TaxID=2950108 RepID=A0ABY4W6I1_9PROT|nr:nucleotidyltransferase family protein [Sneathiella marina]USG61330.1 nucleotidyltransferase family protein [Sneathiella marina]
MTVKKNSDSHAMILAAGKGTRLRPRTETTPKPLVKVAGKALIDYSFDLLRKADIQEVVVNKHHLGDQIDEHVRRKQGFNIHVSDETSKLLETGGGVRKALPMLGPSPFFVLNSDVIVLDHGPSSLRKMQEFWNPEKMDALLLLHPIETAVGYEGQGDFFLGDTGQLTRRSPGQSAPFMFSGVQLLNPALFEDVDEGVFSLNVLYDKAAATGRLFGLRHDGQWLHVGTEDALLVATEKINGT